MREGSSCPLHRREKGVGSNESRREAGIRLMTAQRAGFGAFSQGGNADQPAAGGGGRGSGVEVRGGGGLQQGVGR